MEKTFLWRNDPAHSTNTRNATQHLSTQVQRKGRAPPTCGHGLTRPTHRCSNRTVTGRPEPPAGPDDAGDTDCVLALMSDDVEDFDELGPDVATSVRHSMTHVEAFFFVPRQPREAEHVCFCFFQSSYTANLTAPCHEFIITVAPKGRHHIDKFTRIHQRTTQMDK